MVPSRGVWEGGTVERQQPSADTVIPPIMQEPSCSVSTHSDARFSRLRLARLASG